MKKIVLLSFVLFSCAAFAQLKKGNTLINGSFSITASKQESFQLPSSTNKTSGFSMMPRAGVFTTDKMALGLGIGYSYMKTEFDYHNFGSPNTSKHKTYGFSFIRFCEGIFH
jgi:hypothetical protein